MIAFSASIFMEKTCSVVLLPSWYAAWSKGILVFNMSQVRLMRQIVSNFLNTDKSIIGRKFPGGPLFFLVLAVVLECQS